MPVVSLNRDAIKSSLSRLTAPRSPGHHQQRSGKSKTANKEAININNNDEHSLPVPPLPSSLSATKTREFDDNNEDDQDDDQDDDDDIFPQEQLVVPSTMPPSSTSSAMINNTSSWQSQRVGSDPPSSSSSSSSAFGTFTNNNNNNNSIDYLTKLQTIQKVYGPNTNIYRDVLKVSPNATPAEIREAFFCLRYDLYQKHDDHHQGSGGSSGGLTSEERRTVEDKMDAIAGAFHIVGDVNRRRAYDASLLLLRDTSGGAGRAGAAAQRNTNEEETDEMGFPISPRKNNRGSPASVARLPMMTTSSSSSSPSKVSMMTTTTTTATTTRDQTLLRTAPRQLSPRQRRTINNYRLRDVNTASSSSTSLGINESRRVVARPVTGGLNARSPPVASNSAKNDSIVGKGGGKTKNAGRESPQWEADFGSGNEEEDDNKMMMTSTSRTNLDSTSHSSPGERDNVNDKYDDDDDENEDDDDEEEDSPIRGGNNLNVREQLLYKSQLKHSQQQQQQQQSRMAAAGSTVTTTTTTASSSSSMTSSRLASRLASRYNYSAARDRGDRYAETNDSEDVVYAKDTIVVQAGGAKKPSQLASPTGVDADLDSDRNSNNIWSKKFGGGGGGRRSGVEEEDDYQATKTTTSSTTRTATTKLNNKNHIQQDDVDNHNYDDNNDDEEEGGEESTFASSYDEDTRTYDDDTQTYDDDTQTYDDTTIGGSTWASADASSYVEPEDTPRHSPGHKKGNIPEPILKSGFNRGEKRSGQESDKRRVTIHSHRGRGEDEEDFSLFEGAMCPNLLSLGAIKEEVNGTYNDFTQALHQVTNAFVINPDDIDRLADKIRDAKIELGENYTRQVNERRGGGLSSGTEVAGLEGGGGAGSGGKKKTVKKASTAKATNVEF